MNLGSFCAAVVAGGSTIASAQSLVPLTATRNIFVESFVVDTLSYSSGYDSDDSHSDTLYPFNRTLNRFLTLGLQKVTTYSSQNSSITASGVSASLVSDETTICPSPGFGMGHSKTTFVTDVRLDAPMRYRVTVTQTSIIDGAGSTSTVNFTLTGPQGAVVSRNRTTDGSDSYTQTGLLPAGVYHFDAAAIAKTTTNPTVILKHARATSTLDFKVFCSADFDLSGFVDLDDYTAFTAAFEEGLDSADADLSGFVDTDDLNAFIEAFMNAC
ncbi:MAG: hypothetical protein IT435_02995 [Phycisphaerales bacterium]|nr:hypothetical protein [Phycisphaerales bacterium]